MRIPAKKFFLHGFISSFIWLTACFTPTKGPKRNLRNASASAPFDAVIIPGIPYDGVQWDSVMKARVLWSYILYKNGLVKNVIYSGAAVYTPYREGSVMALYGLELGIPQANIFVDTQARHSTENVYYSYLLAKDLGFKTIALGTDPFQSFMLRSFTRRRFGSPIFLLPFVADSLRKYNGLSPVIDASSAKAGNWQSIRDQQSFWSRLRGTMGKDIDWRKYPGGQVGPLQ